MASVKLVRRWGSHEAGQTVEVDDTMAKWLLGTNHAEDPSKPGTAAAGSTAPGTDGPDLRAGGDVTRPGTPTFQRASRVTGVTEDNPEGEHANRGARVAGAPRAVGDVSHVAPENLGKEHRDNPGDILLASGKMLSQQQAEDQRAADERDRQASGDSAPQGEGQRGQTQGGQTQGGQTQGGQTQGGQTQQDQAQHGVRGGTENQVAAPKSPAKGEAK